MGKNLVSLSFALSLCLPACGDDSGGSPIDAPRNDGGGGGGDGGIDGPPDPCIDNGGADCFELPMGPVTVAGVGDGGTEIAPNLGCGPPAVMTSETPVTLNGTTIEITSNDPVGDVPVVVYYDLFGTPATQATSAANGTITLNLPAPVPSFMNFTLSRDEGFMNYGYNVELNVNNPTINGLMFPSAGRDSTELVAGILGESFDTTKGYLAGTVYDCDGTFIAHLVATVSSTSSTGTNAAPTFVPGASVYYFGTGAIPLPVPRAMREETNTNGGFLVTRIPPTASSQRYYLQVWGFLTADAVSMGMAGLSLVAELPVVIFPDSLHGTFLYPTEGP